MATTWQELFVLPDGAPDRAESEGEREPDERRGVFRRLRDNLSKSRKALADELSASLGDTLDAETWERLEETLILADVGARTTADVVGRLEQEAEAGRVADPDAVRARLIEMLAAAADPGDGRIDLTRSPTVIMVVGVNGSGKTTTIGKIAWHLQRELGRSVILAAADTYRAAAVEQLEAWADRAGSEIVKGAPGGDPGRSRSTRLPPPRRAAPTS
jgi:fused signal recognition particle receptor